MSLGRVVGLGRRGAGDDGVGPAVIDALREKRPPGVELVEIGEPCALISLLETRCPVVVVDAVVIDGCGPGRVVWLAANAPWTRARSVSTHGVDLAQTLALARALVAPDRLAPSISILGIAIAIAAAGPSLGLSPAVAAAVPRAVEGVIRSIARVRARRGPGT